MTTIYLPRLAPEPSRQVKIRSAGHVERKGDDRRCKIIRQHVAPGRSDFVWESRVRMVASRS
jgi:hypothetical protein